MVATQMSLKERLVVVKEEGGMQQEIAVRRRKLLHTGRINKKTLLHGAGSYSQYPVINHSGKEYSKECMYIFN